MTITAEKLRTIAPHARDEILLPLIDPLNDLTDAFGISLTVSRLCHFLAQAAHETDQFKTLTEYHDGSRYEGRRDLGNTLPGDGPKYRGRGIFQITGRANYLAASEKVGLDLIAEPELAATPHVAVLTACHYWNDRKLSDLVDEAATDEDALRIVTRKINGGFNGLDDRRVRLKLAREAFGEK